MQKNAAFLSYLVRVGLEDIEIKRLTSKFSLEGETLGYACYES